MKLHSIVIRAWQKGAGYDEKPLTQAFESRLVRPIELMLHTSNSDLNRIVVVVNGDDRFPSFLGENIAEDGSTPTVRMLRHHFGEQIDVIVEKNWGNNAGSATALNTGWQYAARNPEVDHILSWNPEMALTGHHVAQMRYHMNEHWLEICGYLREGHWERPQFGLFQNTGAMYRLSTLQEVDGFSEHTNGNDGITIETERLGRVTRAGMDDQDFLAHVTAVRGGEVPRIGMIGRSDPAPWQTQFPDDPDRQEMFDIKVERQYAVLREWVTMRLPGQTLEQYLGRVFRNMYIGG